MASYYKSQPEEPTTAWCFPGNSLRNIDGYNVRDGNLNQLEQDTIVRWNMEIKEPGTYKIDVMQKNVELDRYIFSVNNKEFRNKDQSTENKPAEFYLGTVTFKKAGIYPVTLKADPNTEWTKKLSFKYFKFTRVD